MAGLRGLSLSDPGHADARLPASHKLAEELSVSLMTVVNVYGKLSSEGYITAQAGNGTFVANHLPFFIFCDPHLGKSPTTISGGAISVAFSRSNVIFSSDLGSPS